MDFEAISNEAGQLKQKLIGLNDQICNLLDMRSSLICQQIDLESDGVGDEVDASESSMTLDSLLTQVKEKNYD